MIKFVSNNTTPSIETCAKIQFIRLLNDLGFKATLYGTSNWPSKFIPFKYLYEFKPESSDLVIVDGLLLRRWSDILHLNIQRYSHGRKLRYLNLVKYAFHSLTSKLWWSRSLKLALYRPHKNQSVFNFFNLQNLEQKLDLNSLLKYSSEEYIAEQNKLIIYDDISPQNNIHNRVTLSSASTIILAGAITEPQYFKNSIIPLLDHSSISQAKKILYTGSTPDFYEKINLAPDILNRSTQIKQTLQLSENF